jgi:hypothetical protein
MQRVLHLFLAAVRAALIGLGGLALAGAVIADRFGIGPAEGWPAIATSALASAPNAMLGIGCGLMALEALYWITARRIPRSTSELTYQGPIGEVTVATDVVINELRQVAHEYPDLVMLEPTVIPRRNSMDLDVDIKIRSGCASAPLCRSLHDRLIELAADRFGMFEMGDIRLHIREIVREPPASADEEGRIQPAPPMDSDSADPDGGAAAAGGPAAESIRPEAPPQA